VRECAFGHLALQRDQAGVTTGIELGGETVALFVLGVHHRDRRTYRPLELELGQGLVQQVETHAVVARVRNSSLGDGDLGAIHIVVDDLSDLADLVVVIVAADVHGQAAYVFERCLAQRAEGACDIAAVHQRAPRGAIRHQLHFIDADGESQQVVHCQVGAQAWALTVSSGVTQIGDGEVIRLQLLQLSLCIHI